MTVTPSEALILDLLSDGRKSYGLELVDRSGGRLEAGTVYIFLKRLAARGEIECWWDDVDINGKMMPRRWCQISKRPPEIDLSSASFA